MTQQPTTDPLPPDLRTEPVDRWDELARLDTERCFGCGQAHNVPGDPNGDATCAQCKRPFRQVMPWLLRAVSR